MTDKVGSVERMYADFAEGDIAAVLALLDEQVEWCQAEGNPYRDDAPTTVGHQQVVDQVFARLPQDFDDFHIRVERIVGLGDTVLRCPTTPDPVAGRWNGRRGQTRALARCSPHGLQPRRGLHRVATAHHQSNSYAHRA